MNNTNREILFRGQTRRYGEKRKNVAGDKMPSNWVYGGICKGDGDYSIIYGSNAFPDLRLCDKYMVYTDTVGQHTGLTDKNGTKIFEGDIVKHYNCTADSTRFDIGLIFWDTNKCRFVRTSKDGNDIYEIWRSYMNDYEVVGNIHDNPELLEKNNE